MLADRRDFSKLNPFCFVFSAYGRTAGQAAEDEGALREECRQPGGSAPQVEGWKTVLFSGVEDSWRWCLDKDKIISLSASNSCVSFILVP